MNFHSDILLKLYTYINFQTKYSVQNINKTVSIRKCTMYVSRNGYLCFEGMSSLPSLHCELGKESSTTRSIIELTVKFVLFSI